MGKMANKIKKTPFHFKMAMKFKCDICGFEREVPREEFKKMNQETFKNNKLFFCDNCNIRMNPISIEVDY